jgi:hypothetical protein
MKKSSGKEGVAGCLCGGAGGGSCWGAMEQADWRIRFDELKLETKIASGEFGAVYAGRFFGAKVSDRGGGSKRAQGGYCRWPSS